MSIPYGTLRDIANELKNIREILEKQSTNEVEEGEWVETQTETQNSNLTFEKAMEEIQTQTIEFPDTHQKFTFARKIEMDGDSIKIGDWEYKGAKKKG